MNLLPTQEEMVSLLEKTGSLRHGYYRYPNGTYANQYLQIAHAMRYYQHMKTMSVALSRKLRANTELRAMIPQLSVVSPATGGLAVAYGIVEALRANMVYWAEEEIEGHPQRFRQYVEPQPGEKILLVDDILRTGRTLVCLSKSLMRVEMKSGMISPPNKANAMPHANTEHELIEQPVLSTLNRPDRSCASRA